MKSIKISFLVFLIVLLLGNSYQSFGQQSRYDGIEISSSLYNRDTYYFGEHLQFLFLLQNHTNELKPYYVRYFGVNTFIRVYDLKSGDVVGDSKLLWEFFQYQRLNYKSQTPHELASFRPGFSMMFPVRLGKEVDGLLQADPSPLHMHTHFYEHLRVLPVGSYKVEVEFHLLPSNEKIVAYHSFDVLDLPASEKDAYKDYVAATVYTNNNHFTGTKEYKSSNANSYESFLSKYPKSIFAEYALSNLVNGVYNYYLPGTDPALKKKYLKQYYLTDFVKLSNLQFNKVKALSDGKRHFEIMGVNPKEAIEKQLVYLKDVEPIISEKIIIDSKEVHKVVGLKNHACEER